MRVLIASKVLAVFDVLDDVDNIEIEEGLYSGQIYDGLTGVQLAIIDFDEVVPHPYSEEMLKELLAEKDVVVANSEEFLADPEGWIAEARQVRGEATELPRQRGIAIASYSGGTGKTTLAMDTAIHFARRTDLPVLLAEFSYGESALAAITGLNMPHLFDLSTQVDVHPQRWKGVTLVPMDYDDCKRLPITQLAGYFEREVAKHVLVVLDLRWPHGLIDAATEYIDDWLVVASPRVDAVENAKKLRRELHTEQSGRRRMRQRTISVVVNQKNTLDSVALTGFERDLELPTVRQPDRFEGDLGERILSFTYGQEIWRQYEPQNLFARVGRRLAFGGGGA